MCEPYHSIVQFEPENLEGMFSGKLGKWAKKIKNFLHFSKMGKGHSETLFSLGTNNLYIPKMDYEVAWWNRSISPDFCNPTLNAKNAAKIYANQTSIGSLTELRRFLETSMECSSVPRFYLQVILNKLLTKKGKRTLEKKLYSISKNGRSWTDAALLPKTIKACLGLTRQRNLLVPEWSDDSKLWLPGR